MKFFKKKKNIVITVIAVALISLIFFGSNKPEEEVKEVNIKKQVKIQTIVLQDEVATNLSASGTIVPREYSVIRSLTPGTVEFLAPVGSEIFAGQSLFSIRDASVENNYFNSLQNFKQTDILTRQRITQAELNLNSAKARNSLAKSNLENTIKQTAQAVKVSQDSAIVNYGSSYNAMSQVMDFLSQGSISDAKFRYKNLSTSNLQSKINTEAQYLRVVEYFLELPSVSNPNELKVSLAQMHLNLANAKLLVDSVVLMLQNALGMPNDIVGTLEGDQVIIAGYQAQINQFISSIINADNSLENTLVNNSLVISQSKNQLELSNIELSNAEIALDSAIHSAELEKNVAQSQFNNAAYNFSNLTLSSPFSGTVLSHFVNIGEQATVGQQLIEIGNLDIFEISVAVDSDFATGLKQGDEVLIDKKHKGIISEIQPTGDINSGKVGITVQAKNVSNNLAAGNVANIEFKLKFEQSDLIIIPIKSATIEASGTTVLVVEDGKAVKRTITLGKVFGDRVSVESGLNQEDELILIDGVFVVEGDEVEPSK